MDLENRIQILAKEGSVEEFKNPCRKQFIAYLEELKENDPPALLTNQFTLTNIRGHRASASGPMVSLNNVEYGSLLLEKIKEIHNYKTL